MIYLLVFIIALLTSLILTPPLIRYVAARGITGDALKGEETPRKVPLLGGLAVAAGFFLSTGLAFLISRGDWLASYDLHYFGLLLGGGIIVILGVYDDIRGIKAPVKLIFQTIAALVLVACGYNLEIVTNPFGGQIQLGIWGIPLIVIWVVGVTNAFNLIDGLDGLAVGVAGIAALTLFFSSLGEPPFISTIAVGLAGACLGFLRYNSYPSRIFLGDTGSLLLGFILAAVAIQGSFKTTAGISLIVPLVALLLPIADTVSAFFRRILKGKTPLRGDLAHFHHKLIDLGHSQAQAVRLLYLLTVNLSLIALIMKYAGRTLAFGILILLGLMLFIFLKILEDFQFAIRSRQSQPDRPLEN